MTKSEYAEKLKDPRWQKKRLEIFERDGWACKLCGGDENTLSIHHLHYTHGKDPWEYENEDLITLCDECHESEFQYRREAEQMLLQTIGRRHFMAKDIEVIASAFKSIPINQATEVTATIIKFIFENEGVYAEAERKFWEDLSGKTRTP